MPENISQKIRAMPTGRQAGGTIRRIVIDREKCIGAGSCMAVAPGVFQLDKDSLAYVADPDSADEDTIRMATESCPVLAITLIDQQEKIIFPNS